MKRSDFLGAIAALLTAPFVKKQLPKQTVNRKSAFDGTFKISGNDLVAVLKNYPKREG
jgi:hypothetical protein